MSRTPPASTPSDLEKVVGVVDRITFHNPQNGFAVLRVERKRERDLVTVVGKIASVLAGEEIEALGRWGRDAEHGPQFQAEKITTARPTTRSGIEKFLGSGVVKGIGPKMAQKIIGCFGDKTLSVLDQNPSFLADVRGIGAKRLAQIKSSWEEQRGVRAVSLLLAEHGVGVDRAVRIYRLYGEQAPQILRTNPYRLAADVRGIGFRTADELAQKLGIPADSPHRAAAAVHHVLEESASDGHTAVAQEELIQKTIELIGVAADRIANAIEAETQQGYLRRDSIDGVECVFLAGLYRAEESIAFSIRSLLQSGSHPMPRIDVEAAIAWVQDKLKLSLSQGQREAIRQATAHPLVVVTGGPGVGKTTLVRSLLEIFAAKGLEIVLAAPTGRAAKRLSETTGRTAKTLHRLLEFDPAAGGFLRGASKPLEGHLFVLDEFSMVDAPLAQHFFNAVPVGSCVVAVGDVDQLPSVGPGAVLSDLISSEVLPVVRLHEIFRQAAESRIVTAAADINQGRLPDLQPPTDPSDFYFTQVENPVEVERIVVRLVQERIPHRFGFDPMSDVQVLTPMNRGTLGAVHLNELLQAALNPPKGKPEIHRYGWTFREGDRVMQTENNYDKEVYNGDLGLIRSINELEQEVVASFDGRELTYDFGDLDQLALAYAMTIHKSQGSEYPAVVLVLHSQHFVMLRRNLVYTGLTRGKRLAVVVGSKKALEMSVGRPPSSRRTTSLRFRLQQAIGGRR